MYQFYLYSLELRGFLIIETRSQHKHILSITLPLYIADYILFFEEAKINSDLAYA